MLIFVYVSYCAANWFAMRGDLAYYSAQMYAGEMLSYDALAFFVGGIVPFVLYTVISGFAYRTLQFKTGGDIKSVRYGLHFAVIAANVLLFALKFIYIAAPLAATMLEIILDPVVTLGFVALYMWYAFKMEYVDKSRFRFVLLQVFGAFVAVYGLLAAIQLITFLV